MPFYHYAAVKTKIAFMNSILQEFIFNIMGYVDNCGGKYNFMEDFCYADVKEDSCTL